MTFSEACKAITGFQPTLTGGDGNDVQLCMTLILLNYDIANGLQRFRWVLASAELCRCFSPRNRPYEIVRN